MKVALGDSEPRPFHQKFTSMWIILLFGLHGFPIPESKQFKRWRSIFRALRIFGISFVNFYFFYRLYRLIRQMNFVYDTFPLINAAVSASLVDSLVVYNHKFAKFSDHLLSLLSKRRLCLSTNTICKLMIFYAMFASYVLVCAIVFPIHANHWFDAGKRNDTAPDFFHKGSLKPCTHITIFVVCSGNVVSHLMLYCLVCCLLQRILVSLQDDLESRTRSNESLREFRFWFIEVANLVRCADNIFSLIGLVGLGGVLSRACSCIHFYLNLKSPFRDSWLFLLLQITFDFCALSALSCFGASVSEEGQKIAPAVFRASQEVSTRNTDFHIQCLAVSKVVMSSEVHLSAWKLFPFSRRVLPTVIGVTISYVVVIIQMHHAASFELLSLRADTYNSTRTG